jgi:hypothetical protein
MVPVYPSPLKKIEIAFNDVQERTWIKDKGSVYVCRISKRVTIFTVENYNKIKFCRQQFNGWSHLRVGGCSFVLSSGLDTLEDITDGGLRLLLPHLGESNRVRLGGGCFEHLNKSQEGLWFKALSFKW